MARDKARREEDDRRREEEAARAAQEAAEAQGKDTPSGMPAGVEAPSGGTEWQQGIPGWIG